MILGFEAALGVIAPGRDVQVQSATGHVAGKGKAYGSFSALVAAAFGTIGLPGALVPPSLASSCEGEGVQGEVSGVTDSAVGPAMELTGLVFGVPGDAEAGSVRATPDAWETSGPTAEPVTLQGFSVQKRFVAAPAELLRSDKPPQSGEQVLRGPALPDALTHANGISHGAGLTEVSQEVPELHQVNEDLPNTARLVSEHVSSIEAGPEGSVSRAGRTAGPAEPAAGAEAAPAPAADEEQAVGVRASGSDRFVSTKAAGSPDFDRENRSVADRTRRGPFEETEAVEDGDTGAVVHTATVENALSPAPSGEVVGEARRGEVSLSNARELAERLREEALKRLPRSVELRLDPPRLGSVTAVLTARGQEVAVKFVAQSREAMQALERSAGDLARSFSEMGLTLAGFSVDQGHPQEAFSWGERGSSVSAARRRSARSFGVEMVSSQAATPYRAALSGSHLDYIV